MQKTIYSLPALRELLAAANRRYLEFLSTLENPRKRQARQAFADYHSGRPLLLRLQFVRCRRRSLVPIDHPRRVLSGLQNKSLRRFLPDKSSGQISRLLKRLRVHGLIKKVGHTYKYYVTSFGKDVIATGLKLRELVIIPQLAYSRVA